MDVIVGTARLSRPVPPGTQRSPKMGPRMFRSPEVHHQSALFATCGFPASISLRALQEWQLPYEAVTILTEDGVRPLKLLAWLLTCRQCRRHLGQTCGLVCLPACCQPQSQGRSSVLIALASWPGRERVPLTRAVTLVTLDLLLAVVEVHDYNSWSRCLLFVAFA